MSIWKKEWLNMKDIIEYPKCESNEDLTEFKSFITMKLNEIFIKYKGLRITSTNMNRLRFELIEKYPIIRDIKDIGNGQITIIFNKVFLLTKNIVQNDDNFALELNNSRYKLLINNYNNIEIIQTDKKGLKVDNVEFFYEMI